MYTIVITNLKSHNIAGLIANTAKTIIVASEGCPMVGTCNGQYCPDCAESHIHVLHDAD